MGRQSFSVQVSIDDGEPPPISKQRIRKIIEYVIKPYQDSYALSLRFTGDLEMRRLHRRFFDVDSSTDVITFDLQAEDMPLIPGEVQGEIILNLMRAKRQAKKHGHSPEAETVLYLVHGLLHICGFDDRSVKAKKKMDAEQNRIVKELEFELCG